MKHIGFRHQRESKQNSDKVDPLFARTLYLTKQHYRNQVPSGEENNSLIFSTLHRR